MDVLIPLAMLAAVGGLFWLGRRRRGGAGCPKCEAGDPCPPRARVRR